MDLEVQELLPELVELQLNLHQRIPNHTQDQELLVVELLQEDLVQDLLVQEVEALVQEVLVQEENQLELQPLILAQ